MFTSQFGYLKSNPHLWKKITIQAQTSIFVWKCSTQKYKKKVQFGGGGSNFKKLISFLYKSKIHAAFIKVGTCRLVEDPLCHKDSQIRQYKVSQ